MFFDLLMDLIPQEAINNFPDPPKEYFGYEEAILIFYRLPKSKEISTVMKFSLLFISQCFLTLWQTQIFMFTVVNFSSQNVFWVEQPW